MLILQQPARSCWRHGRGIWLGSRIGERLVLVNLLEVREGRAAGWTPGGPEIEQDDVAFFLRELHVLAVGALKREVERLVLTIIVERFEGS